MAVIERDRLIAVRTTLAGRLKALGEQKKQFRSIRLKALATQIAEAEASVVELEADLGRASGELERADALLAREVVSAGRQEVLAAQVAVVGARLSRAHAQLAGVVLEHDTLTAGGHFGDQYNNRARPDVEAEAIELRLAEVGAHLEAQIRRVEVLGPIDIQDSVLI